MSPRSGDGLHKIAEGLVAFPVCIPFQRQCSQRICRKCLDKRVASFQGVLYPIDIALLVELSDVFNTSLAKPMVSFARGERPGKESALDRVFEIRAKKYSRTIPLNIINRIVILNT